MKVTINQQRKVDKRSLLADITEAYERDNNVKPRYLARLLNCDLNHVRIVITNIKYKEAKDVFKPYNIAPPETREARHTDSNRWHDIEEDIKHVNVDELYKQATR
jgi:hypothetical protein